MERTSTSRPPVALPAEGGVSGRIRPLAPLGAARPGGYALALLALGLAGVACWGLRGGGSGDPAPEPLPLAGDGDRSGAPQAASVPVLAPGIVTLLPGVHLLGETYPNAAYVVESSDGLTLVDTCREADAGPILRQFRTLGLDPARLRRILLTHCHADHVLGARRLRELSGALVHVGRGDADVLRDGGPEEALCSVFDMSHPTHGTPVDVLLDGGEEIPAGEDRFRVLATPGHTPGSVCYLLERQGRAILFTGDTVMSLSDSHPLAGPGDYAAALAPRFRGDAAALESSLAMLAAMPLPDLVLPGHPRNDPMPERPEPADWWWQRILARGMERLREVQRRFREDGADFLDGSPREILPGLHYRGDRSGVALYAIAPPGGSLYLVNAPGGAELGELARASALDAGVGSGTPTAILLTSCAPSATEGLRSLVESARCPVYAPDDGLEEIRSRCPPGADVRPASTLAAFSEHPVRVIAMGGLSSPSVCYLFAIGRRSVLFSGEGPDAVTIEPEDTGPRWSGVPPLDRAEALRAIETLASVAPEVWLPLRPLAAPNANLYEGDWARTIHHNREFLERGPR